MALTCNQERADISFYTRPDTCCLNCVM